MKAAGSGLLIATALETARRFPGFGATRKMSNVWPTHHIGTIWFLAPLIPKFFAIPTILRARQRFRPSLIASCTLTLAPYALMVWLGPRFGLKL